MNVVGENRAWESRFHEKDIWASHSNFLLYFRRNLRHENCGSANWNKRPTLIRFQVFQFNQNIYTTVIERVNSVALCQTHVDCWVMFSLLSDPTLEHVTIKQAREWIRITEREREVRAQHKVIHKSYFFSARKFLLSYFWNPIFIVDASESFTLSIKHHQLRHESQVIFHFTQTHRINSLVN